MSGVNLVAGRIGTEQMANVVYMGLMLPFGLLSIRHSFGGNQHFKMDEF